MVISFRFSFVTLRLGFCVEATRIILLGYRLHMYYVCTHNLENPDEDPKSGHLGRKGLIWPPV